MAGMSEALHDTAEGDRMREGFSYDSTGRGVSTALIDAVKAAWSVLAPSGDPADPLRYVNQGSINSVDNLARIAALAVAQRTAAPPVYVAYARPWTSGWELHVPGVGTTQWVPSVGDLQGEEGALRELAAYLARELGVAEDSFEVRLR